MATTSNIPTPSLSPFPRYPDTPSDASTAHKLLMACGKPSAETRYLVSLVLRTVRDYLDGQDTLLFSHKEQNLVMCQPDSLVMLCVGLGVDLKNEAWTGDVLVDANTMFGKIVTCLGYMLLDFTDDDYGAAITVAGETLANLQRSKILECLPCGSNTGLKSSEKRKRWEMEAEPDESEAEDEVHSEDEVEDLIECQASPTSEGDSHDLDHQTCVSPPFQTAKALAINMQRYCDCVEVAKMCADFMFKNFSCDITSTTFESRSTPVPNLVDFILNVLYRVNLPPSFTFYALCLLARYKIRRPGVGGPFGHGMFMTAYVVASKMLFDYAPRNNLWQWMGSDIIGLEELNAMEYAMCELLEWDLIIDREERDAFEDFVREWHGPDCIGTATVFVPGEVGGGQGIEDVEADIAGNDEAGFEADDEGEEDDEWEYEEDEEEMAWVEDEISLLL